MRIYVCWDKRAAGTDEIVAWAKANPAA